MLSVIVPVYNIEDYILSTLESLSNQDYDDIEFIIVDDGSDDMSGSFCDNYCLGKPQFRVFHKTNGGVSSARNFGLSHAKGNYISFVDGDDSIKRDLFSVLMREIEKNDFDLVQCNFVKETSSKTESLFYDQTMILSGGIEGCKHLFYPNKKISNSVCGKVFKKNIISTLKFDETLSIGEDLKFSFEAVLRAKKIKLLQYSGYYYFSREGSAMESKFSIKRFDDFIVNDWIVREYGNDSELKKRVLTRDAKNAAECYYSLVCESAPDQKKQKYIISRLRKDKTRYSLNKKYEIFIWSILHLRCFVNPFLRTYYKRKRKNAAIK